MQAQEAQTTDFISQVFHTSDIKITMEYSIMARCTAWEDSGLDEHLERLETVLIAWTVLVSK